MDVTDIVDYNIQLINKHDPSHSFFNLAKDDPTIGFPFDASVVAGCVYPANANGLWSPINAFDDFSLRLCIGSHLALHLRHTLEHNKGYTSTVGISTSKLLSKLVGNVNKPNEQTTLMPPYRIGADSGNVAAFLDPHEIGAIPNIGFKLAQKLREYVLGRPAKFHAGLIYGKTQESITVENVRLHPNMGPALLDKILSGSGTPRGIGRRVWELVNGVDDAEVNQARQIPTQISMEDSYIRLDTWDQATKELRMLSVSLIKRMHMDLLEEDEDGVLIDQVANNTTEHTPPRRWLAQPRTLKLSTRPRPAPNPDWTRSRAFNRMSRSTSVPNFLFNLNESDEMLAEQLVHEALLPLFRKLHPEKSGWNLSLVNVAVTNMADMASDNKSASGRDIGKMFKKQDEVLREWRVEDVDTSSAPLPDRSTASACTERSKNAYGNDFNEHTESTTDFQEWEDDEDDALMHGSTCQICGLVLPDFAMLAHQRYHLMGD